MFIQGRLMYVTRHSCFFVNLSYKNNLCIFMSGIGTREISLTKEIGGSWGGVWPQSFWTSNWHNLFERHSSANRDKLKGGWERKKFTDNPIDWTKSEAYLTTKRCEYKYITKKWETSEEKSKMINLAIPCAWLHLLMGYLMNSTFSEVWI